MRTPRQAAALARLTKFNKPDTCQYVTRGWLDAPSAGDYDHDGAADAEDGWKKEPQWARRADRNPPEGYPVTYSGGSNDNWHRALSLGNGKIRSTDAGGRGVTATVDLDWPEKTWGMKYVGWSVTMDGVKIPKDKRTRGFRVDAALTKLVRAERRSKEGTLRDNSLDRAIAAIKRIPGWFKKP